MFEFAEAARLVKQEHSCRFVLAGGEYEGNPSSLTASDLQLWVEDGTNEWLGHRTDIADLLRQCNIYVLPSYYGEGIPKSLIEAAAAGRALVITDMPGCRDVVTDGVDGLLVPPRDSNALAQAIEHLLVDDQRRFAMGERSRERAEQDSGLAMVLNAHLTLYDNLLGSNSRGMQVQT